MGAIFIIGHRGSEAYEPENTLRSFRRALELGADMVELDVHHTSSDGRLVVMHDATLDRTTDGTGPIEDHTAEELRTLDAGKGERIPFLEDVLAFARGTIKLNVHTELQSAAPDVLNAIVENDMLDEVLVTAGNPEVLRGYRELSSEVQIGLLGTSYGSDAFKEVVPEMGANVLTPNYRFVTPELVRWAHDRGLPVYTWASYVHDREELIRLIRSGVDGIGTSRPDLVRAIADEIM